jgi:hypothetical protein
MEQLLSIFRRPSQRAKVKPPVSGIEAAAKAALASQARIHKRAEDLGIAVGGFGDRRPR